MNCDYTFIFTFICFASFRSPFIACIWKQTYGPGVGKRLLNLLIEVLRIYPLNLGII